MVSEKNFEISAKSEHIIGCWIYDQHQKCFFFLFKYHLMNIVTMSGSDGSHDFGEYWKMKSLLMMDEKSYFPVVTLLKS